MGMSKEERLAKRDKRAAEIRADRDRRLAALDAKGQARRVGRADELAVQGQARAQRRAEKGATSADPQLRAMGSATRAFDLVAKLSWVQLWLMVLPLIIGVIVFVALVIWILVAS